MKYLGGLFTDASISTSDDDDFPGQVRNVLDGEFGLWSEVTLDDDRIERPQHDAEGGVIAGESHSWRELGERKRVYIWKSAVAAISVQAAEWTHSWG